MTDTSVVRPVGGHTSCQLAGSGKAAGPGRGSAWGGSLQQPGRGRAAALTAAPEPADLDPRGHDLDGLAGTWAKVLDRTPHVLMTRAEQYHLLRGLGDRLAAALRARPPARFDPMVGYWVATELVTAGFDTPEALGRRIAVLETQLPAPWARATRKPAAA